nr:MAG TPA: hypothetical protein [Bacteriophage sp.]
MFVVPITEHTYIIGINIPYWTKYTKKQRKIFQVRQTVVKIQALFQFAGLNHEN